MTSTSDDLTRLLLASCDGDEIARERFASRLYEELRVLAYRYASGESAGEPLRPAAFLNEAWHALVREDAVGSAQRAEFLSRAAMILRRIVVDCSRRAAAAPFEDAGTQPLDRLASLLRERAGDLEELERALASLALVDPRKARLVDLRFFGGCSPAEAAEILGVPLLRVERDWITTRAWLRSRLGGGAEVGRT